MDDFPAETLLELLTTYETAVAELRRTSDRRVEGLILRLSRHRAEVISQLAARDGSAHSALRRAGA